MNKNHQNFTMLKEFYFLVILILGIVFFNTFVFPSKDNTKDKKELNLAHMELNSYYFSDNDLNSTRFGIKKASEIISRYDLFILGLPEDINSSEISYILNSIDYHLKVYKSITFRSEATIYYQNTLDLNRAFLDEDNKYYAVHVESKERNLDFAIMGLTIDSNDIFIELLNLDKHIKRVEKIFSENLVILMGNLYADCDYIDEKVISFMPIRSKEYVWLIENYMDTFTSDSNCTYSRIIVTDDFETIAEKGRTYKTDQNLSDYIVEFSFVTEAFDPL